jgi:hypothetical protein
MTRALLACLATLGILAAAAAANGQDIDRGPSLPTITATPSSTLNRPLAPGWTFTPTFTYSTGWDDNVLLRSNGDDAPADLVNVLNPRAAVDFNGSRGQLDLNYDGAFLLYRDLNTLNSYDQHASFSARRLVSPHVAFFVRNTTAIAPTTDLVEFVAVPFERTGSKIDDAHAGVEAALSKDTTVIAAYHFQWVSFDDTPEFNAFLHGGTSNGATGSIRHRISERTSIIADTDIEHSVVGDTHAVFDVQNVEAGVEHQFSELLSVYAAGGVAHLNVSDYGPARTGPSWRAGIIRQFRRAGVDLSYSQSFVPSYGFGGTFQNRDLTGRVRVPLSGNLYTSASTSWRKSDPLTVGELGLTSLWFDATVGYSVSQWARIEAFYSGARQTIARAGGEIDLNRAGIQVVTSKPMRVR